MKQGPVFTGSSAAPRRTGKVFMRKEAAEVQDCDEALKGSANIVTNLDFYNDRDGQPLRRCGFQVIRRELWYDPEGNVYDEDDTSKTLSYARVCTQNSFEDEIFQVVVSTGLAIATLMTQFSLCFNMPETVSPHVRHQYQWAFLFSTGVWIGVAAFFAYIQICVEREDVHDLLLTGCLQKISAMVKRTFFFMFNISPSVWQVVRFHPYTAKVQRCAFARRAHAIGHEHRGFLLAWPKKYLFEYEQMEGIIAQAPQVLAQFVLAYFQSISMQAIKTCVVQYWHYFTFLLTIMSTVWQCTQIVKELMLANKVYKFYNEQATLAKDHGDDEGLGLARRKLKQHFPLLAHAQDHGRPKSRADDFSAWSKQPLLR